MKIWKNTSTLNGYDNGLIFTEDKNQADIALLGSKPINLFEFPILKGIFRAGIGKDNVPEKDALEKGARITISPWNKFQSKSFPTSTKSSGQYLNSLVARMINF